MFPAGMAEIVLTTLNAKYLHAAFGLRYLLANLGSLASRAMILEFDVNQRPVEVAERILARRPRLVGLGVYIWNVQPATELVAALKRVAPALPIVLGGPEVSHETGEQPIVALADHVVTGEADLVFPEVCRAILEGHPPAQKVVAAPLPDLARVAMPYACYTEEDIAHRVVYVEASRGCPFTCEFCLSSLDVPVRQFDTDRFLEEMQGLLDRGVKQFKFVDRTFNLHLPTSRRILEFFLERHGPGCFYHFEMIPDRLPEGLRELIERFPAGSLQFEVGIQSFNEEVCERISRRQHVGRLEDNLKFLRERTGVHVHADLIVGLPGETVESFGSGFDRLIGMGPQEIQVGILKRLRGTPITRHDEAFGMAYHPHPPYEILQTRDIPFGEMQRMRRFARYWDLVANSGNFVSTTPLLWNRPGGPESAFGSFLEWSDWLYGEVGRTDAIALSRLAEHLFRFLTERVGHPSKLVAGVLWEDYQRGARRDPPTFLRPHLPEGTMAQARARVGMGAPMKRQDRHLARPES